MTTARELITKIGFKVDDSGLNRAKQGISNFKHAAIGLGIEIAAVSGALFELAKHTAHTLENIEISSERVGISTENFQKLTYAVGQYGVEQEDVTRSLGILAVKFQKAKEKGDEAMKVFTSAGFTEGQIKSFKTMDELILALGDKVKNISDPIKQLALARELLGRSGARWLPLFKQGSAAVEDMMHQAELLGMVIDEHTIQAGARFERQWKTVISLFDAFKTKVGAILLPELSRVIGSFLEWMKSTKNQEILQNSLKDVTMALVNVFKGFLAVGVVVAVLFKELSDAVGGSQNAITLLLTAFGAWKSLQIVLAITEVVGAFKLMLAPLWESAAAMGALDVAAAPPLVTFGLFAILFLELSSIISQLTTRWDDFTRAVRATPHLIGAALGFKREGFDEYGNKEYQPKNFAPLSSLGITGNPAGAVPKISRSVANQFHQVLNINMDGALDPNAIAMAVDDNTKRMLRETMNASESGETR